MNKKGGSTRELVQKIGYLILVILVIVFIWVIVFNHINLNLDTTEQQHRLLTLNLINSKECLAYEDPLTGVQPSRIDPEKLTSARLENCLNKTRTGYRVFILDTNKQIVKNAANIDLTMNSQFPICAVNKDFFKCTLNTEFILYKTAEGFKQGFIVVEVVSRV